MDPQPGSTGGTASSPDRGSDTEAQAASQIMLAECTALRTAAEMIAELTELRRVQLVPEIWLHQAAEPVSVWQRVEQATGQTDLDPPYWAFAWPGGQVLARYVLDHPETIAGRRVIDLASGSGLVAIAAARAGAAGVTAYDVDPLAAAAITVNAAANQVTVRAVCADILDRDEVPDGASLLLVADAFYEHDLACRVLRFLDRASACGVAVLVGDLGRAYLPRDRLQPLAAYDVPGLAALEDRDVKRATVWAPRP
jgi:predicted nicotinamide N-methyase